MADSFDKSSTLNIDGEVLNRSSFAKGNDEKLARRTVNDGRSSTPNIAEIFSMFNPLSMPLRKWTRMYELHFDTENFTRGIYFINETFIQFQIRVYGTYPAFDTEIVENNILLLSDNVALELDATDEDNPLPISGVFLELE